VAVIGDGSMSAGMAYEAMNNAAHTTGQLTVNSAGTTTAVSATPKYPPARIQASSQQRGTKGAALMLACQGNLRGAKPVVNPIALTTGVLHTHRCGRSV